MQPKTSGTRPFTHPDEKIAAARAKVAKLEQALAALGDTEGPEIDV